MKTVEISITVKFEGNYNLKERTDSVMNIMTSGLRGEVTQINAVIYEALTYGLAEPAKKESEEIE